MAFKTAVLCVAALLVETISGGIISKGCGCGSGYGYGCGSGYGSSAVSNSGGALIVTSYSPLAPSGISLASELGLFGELGVQGVLPFLSAVAFEGCMDTKGSGTVCYGCGDGCIGIESVNGGYSSGCGCGYSSGCGCGYSSGCGCGCY